MKLPVELPQSPLGEDCATVQQDAELWRLSHTVVSGRTFPEMSFAQMLDATTPNRLVD